MPALNNSDQNILLIAAEASSSLYALRILEEMRAQRDNTHFWGVGSREMESMGFERLGKSEEMAVVGLQEVLAHYKDIKAVLTSIVKQAEERKPKVAVLLDYPGFNLRLAKELKKLGIPVVYYISPQVWAWHRSRIKQIREYVEKMLVLFPFEKDFYDKTGVDCEFVGHPLLDEIHSEYFTKELLKNQRQRFGLSLDDKILALMPGSRNSEIKYNLRTQMQTARILKEKYPKLKVMLFVAPTFEMQQFREYLTDITEANFEYTLVKKEPFDMIHMADVILTASGTATMMVGLMLKPMVIMYKMNSISAWILQRLVRKRIDNIGMINLILGKQVCPEFLQNDAIPEKLSAALEVLLTDVEKYKTMVEELKKCHQLLGEKGASKRVVEVIKSYLK